MTETVLLNDINKMSFHDAALAYATLEIPVLPLRPQRKEPLLSSHGVHDATVDVSQINRWWTDDPERNIGLVLPASTILDVDARNGGLETFREMVAGHGMEWFSNNISFTPTSGFHIFFALTNERIVPLQGIDVLRQGKYVVGPPSIHPLGGRYEWAADASVHDILPEIPDWLVYRPHVVSSQEPPTPPRKFSPPYARAALKSEIDNVGRAPTGVRNIILNKAAFNLARKFVNTRELDPVDIAVGLLDAAVFGGLPQNEAEKTILSGMRAGVAT